MSDELPPALEQRLDKMIALLASLEGSLAPPWYRLPGQQAAAGANGFATIAFPAFPGGVDKVWMVERLFLSSTTTNAVAATVYVMEGWPLTAGAGVNNPNALQAALPITSGVDFTNLNTAAGDEFSPVPVKGGEILAVQWAGLSAGAICTASAMYRLGWQAPQ